MLFSPKPFIETNDRVRSALTVVEILVGVINHVQDQRVSSIMFLEDEGKLRLVLTGSRRMVTVMLSPSIPSFFDCERTKRGHLRRHF